MKMKMKMKMDSDGNNDTSRLTRRLARMRRRVGPLAVAVGLLPCVSFSLSSPFFWFPSFLLFVLCFVCRSVHIPLY